MKRFIPTIVLVALCIAGFWYASSQDFFKEKEEDPAVKQFFKLSTAEVSQVQVTDGEETLELSKVGGEWSMAKPSPIPVNTFSADGWVTTFATLSYDSVVEENASDLAKYGLDQPKRQFIVRLNGEEKKLMVGNELPVPGAYYVLTSNSQTVYELSETSVKQLNKKQIDFLEKSAVKFTYNLVQSLQMNWKGASWELIKAEPAKTVYDSTWKLGDREMSAADGNAILDKLIYLSTDQMVKPVKEVKLNAPEFKLVIKEAEAGKETTNVFTGQIDGENLWIAQEGSVWAYSVPVQRIQDLHDKAVGK